MHLFFVWLGLTLAAGPRPQAPSQVTGYQATRWGMTEHQVLALYPSALHVESDDALEWVGLVDGRNANLTFVFFYPGSELSEVHLLLHEGNPNCVADFYAVQDQLVANYGPPKTSQLQFVAREPGPSVAAGDLAEKPDAELLSSPKPLSMKSTWELGHTVVVHEGNCNGSVWGKRVNSVWYSAASFADHAPLSPSVQAGAIRPMAANGL